MAPRMVGGSAHGRRLRAWSAAPRMVGVSRWSRHGSQAMTGSDQVTRGRSAGHPAGVGSAEAHPACSLGFVTGLSGACAAAARTGDDDSLLSLGGELSGRPRPDDADLR